MEFTTINTDIIQNTLDAQITKAINTEIEQLLKQMQKEMPAKLQAAKADLFGSFQTIVLTEMQLFFLKTYGPNYDVNSLNNSITCVLKNNLQPDFSYDKNVFKFNSTLKKNTRAFNQNARKEATFKNYMYQDEFNSIEQEDNYEMSDNPFDEAWDEVQANQLEDNEVFKPINKMHQQGGFAKLDTVYKQGKIETMRQFKIQYEKVIKPRIIKKYGLKLK